MQYTSCLSFFKIEMAFCAVAVIIALSFVVSAAAGRSRTVTASPTEERSRSATSHSRQWTSSESRSDDLTLTASASPSVSPSVSPSPSVSVTSTVRCSFSSSPKATRSPSFRLSAERTMSATSSQSRGSWSLALSTSHSKTPSPSLAPTITVIATPNYVSRTAFVDPAMTSQRTVTFRCTGSTFDPTLLPSLHRLIHLQATPTSSSNGLYAQRDTIFGPATKAVLASGSLVITFQASPTFYIRYDESVTVEFDRLCFADKSQGARAIFSALAIPPDPPVPSLLIAVVEGVSSVAFFLGGCSLVAAPLVLYPQRAVASLKLEACDFQDGALLSVFRHPLIFSIGSSREMYMFGAVVGNTILLICISLFAAGVAHYIAERDSRTFTASMTKLRFPALVIFPFCLLYQPTVASAVIVLVEAPDLLAQSVCGVLGCGWVVAAIVFLIRVLHKPGAAFVGEAAEQEQQRPHWIDRSTGHWEDDDLFLAQNRDFLRKFGSLFQIFRDRRELFVCAELGISTTFAVAEGSQPLRGKCGPLFIAIVIAMVVYAVLLFVLRPFRRNRDAFAIALHASVLLIGVSLLAIPFSTPSPSAAQTGGILICAASFAFAIWCLWVAFLQLREWLLAELGNWRKRRAERKAQELAELLVPPKGEPPGLGTIPTLSTLLLSSPLSDENDDLPVLRPHVPRKKRLVHRDRLARQNSEDDDHCSLIMNGEMSNYSRPHVRNRSRRSDDDSDVERARAARYPFHGGNPIRSHRTRYRDGLRQEDQDMDYDEDMKL